VHLKYLSLTNFRNYVRLELNVPDRLTVIQGGNAQGKTNLLDAIHLIATGRSPRATNERELVNWAAADSSLPYARLLAEIGEGKQAQKIELVIEVARNGGWNVPAIRKQVRINGVPKRALDLVGRLRVVLFLPEDVALVAGAPVERRRYLDIALCQMYHSYCRSLSEFNRTVTQRNALLRQLRERGGDARQLTFWNTRLVEHGSVIVQARMQAIERLDTIAGERHLELTGGSEQLRLGYIPGMELGEPAVTERNGSGAEGLVARRRRISESPVSYRGMDLATLRETFMDQLQKVQAREIAAGTSLLGPHRDDMVLHTDGHDLRMYGSRGQQRTGALAIKLAEVRLMQEATGETPLLLLDDVMSELDLQRRRTLLTALATVQQAIVTTTDWDAFSSELLEQARTYSVLQGALRPCTPPPRAQDPA